MAEYVKPRVKKYVEALCRPFFVSMKNLIKNELANHETNIQTMVDDASAAALATLQDRVVVLEDEVITLKTRVTNLENQL